LNISSPGSKQVYPQEQDVKCGKVQSKWCNCWAKEAKSACRRLISLRPLILSSSMNWPSKPSGRPFCLLVFY